MKPIIGNWYRITGSDSFEVVVMDNDNVTIELQNLDGNVEVMSCVEWQPGHENDSLGYTVTPGVWTGADDVDPEEGETRDGMEYGVNDEQGESASKLGGLDLFE